MRLSIHIKQASLLVILALALSSYTYQKVIPIAEHYQGGQDKMLQDIKANIKYPPAAKRNRKQGTIIVRVKLMENGTLGYAKVVSDKLGAGCGAEAVRVIKTLKFNAPGYIAEYNIPVAFKL